MPDPVSIRLAGPLDGFAPISLAEMEAVKLMNRVDTKYLTDEATLEGVLRDAAAAGYRVLVADGARVSPYDSIYFDTEGLKMFTDHRNQKLHRQKVRTRAYVNSGEAFLEIKRKDNHGRTKKKRTGIPLAELPDFRADEAACRYLDDHSDFSAEQVQPTLETAFRRITLVNPNRTERVTIDTDLRFKNFRTGLETALGDAVVIELKQSGRGASLMKDILLAHRVKVARVSKYCIAVTLTDPSARAGRFREKVRLLEKTVHRKITTL